MTLPGRGGATVGLGTTALTEFWPETERLVLLGPWCRTETTRAAVEGRGAEILSSPWPDRADYVAASRSAAIVYEHMLAGVGEWLNTVHGLQCSPRYWRILVGPFLLNYVHALYDRHQHLMHARRVLGEFETTLVDGPRLDPGAGCLDFVARVIDDAYNLQLMTLMMQQLGWRGPTRALSRGALPARQQSAPKQVAGWLAYAAAVVRARVLSAVPGRVGSIVLGDLYVGPIAPWALSLRLLGLAVPLKFRRGVLGGGSEAGHAARADVSRLDAASDFERLALALLPQTLPRLYLEDFALVRSRVTKALPAKARAVVATVGWQYDEAFKFMAAEAAQRGAELIVAQHGGGYGIDDLSPNWDHERAISDQYWCWGWADAGDTRAANVPSVMLSREVTAHVPRRGRAGAAGDIILISNNYARYLYRFHTMPTREQGDAYFDWAVRFLRSLPPATRADSVLRLYPEDYGRELQRLFSRLLPDVRLDTGGPLLPRLSQARLVVVDHCSTTLLETLALNIPTVLFWDPATWVTRQEARADIEGLVRGGILYQSPEAAAAAVARIARDPAAWWSGSETQRARAAFVQRYALSSDHWMRDWGTALRAVGAPAGVAR